MGKQEWQKKQAYLYHIVAEIYGKACQDLQCLLYEPSWNFPLTHVCTSSYVLLKVSNSLICLMRPIVHVLIHKYFPHIIFWKLSFHEWTDFLGTQVLNLYLIVSTKKTVHQLLRQASLCTRTKPWCHAIHILQKGSQTISQTQPWRPTLTSRLSVCRDAIELSIPPTPTSHTALTFTFDKH